MIYVLTYDHPHRKTQDILMHLKVRNYSDVTVLITPWIERKNFVPLFNLKPEPFSYSPQQMCRELDYDFIEISDINLAASYYDNELILIAGAPILPENLVKSNTIINSHCGYLPTVRGLDALKWAIYYDEPIAVTTHVVDADIDIGKKIERREVRLYTTDDLYKVAIRQYELEIQMLIDAIDKWKGAEAYGEPSGTPSRRMPHRTELVMKQRFEDRKMAINE